MRGPTTRLILRARVEPNFASVAGVGDFRFSADEYAARLARIREHLVEAELDACIVLAPDTQFWLSGFDSFISGVLPQALIFTPDAEDPTLVLWDADVPLARDGAVVDDIRDYRFGVDDPVAAFAEVLAEKAPRARRVGFDGSSRAVPHTLGDALSAAVAPATLIDCFTLLCDARVVKSPRELDCLRRAGEFADVGLRAAREHARPGVTERRLAAEIEYAMRCAGSDYPSIPTELGSGPRALFGHGTPSHRVMEPGDLVHIEVGGVEARYNCVGYGVGVGYPPTWLDPLQITRTSSQRLVPGSTFVLHACLLSESEQTGVVVGGTYAMTSAGVEILSGAGAVELLTV